MEKSKNNGRIVIGKIIKPQGIKGELKICPLTDNILRFNGLKHIYLGSEDNLREIKNIRISGDDVFMFIEGIISRNDAEAARNLYISVDRENAVKPKEGSYFITDMIGCKVYAEDDEYLGTVKDIIQNGAADVFEISLNGKIYMFPFVDGLAAEIDIANKKITVCKKRFDEVACYED